MNKKRKPLELYVHIPFCIRKCAYCDFVSGPGTKAMQKEYEEALLAEIDAAEETAEREVISVFFGGGTPSAVDAGMLARVMEKLRSKYVFSEDAEITLEANPGTLDAEKLKCYRKSGFNRISIGCQSVHDEELKRLGRIHTFAEFQESFVLARDAGFANINVDLMSGLPEQSEEKWEESLRTIAELSPEHISAYSLIVEPRLRSRNWICRMRTQNAKCMPERRKSSQNTAFSSMRFPIMQSRASHAATISATGKGRIIWGSGLPRHRYSETAGGRTRQIDLCI